jgi:alkylated DNA repair dioxygenase AlkB
MHLQPKVEEITGKKLYPAYSYARIYYNKASMPCHIDRPACQYSVSITIEVDPTPWEIWMENHSGDASAIMLNVGDMIVYQGDKLKHWRDEYPGKKQIQAFLHYVDADGKYADYKYDKRAYLGREIVND